MSDFGVVIPPDKGDANYEGGEAAPNHDSCCDEWCNHCTVCGTGILYGSLCSEHFNRPVPLASPDAPDTPHAPTSAPGTPQRGSVDGGDDSEAPVDLVESAARAMAVADYFSRSPATYVALARAALTAPLVVAYGDQRAAAALREAANAYGPNFGVRRFMHACADELGRQA